MKVEVLEVSHNNVRDSESCTENKLMLLKVFLQATESWSGPQSSVKTSFFR